jgi:hypothetical protein
MMEEIRILAVQSVLPGSLESLWSDCCDLALARRRKSVVA